jgi:TP901 family phage tail tape measure protein
MAEDTYRIAVGIDAADAVAGSKQFEDATRGVYSSAEKVIDRLDKIVELLDKSNDKFTRVAKGGAVEYQRVTEGTAEATDKATKNLKDNVAVLDEQQKLLKLINADSKEWVKKVEYAADYLKKQNDLGVRQNEILQENYKANAYATTAVKEQVDATKELEKVSQGLAVSTEALNDNQKESAVLAKFKQEQLENEAARTAELNDKVTEYVKAEVNRLDVLRNGAAFTDEFAQKISDLGLEYSKTAQQMAAAGRTDAAHVFDQLANSVSNAAIELQNFSSNSGLKGTIDQFLGAGSSLQSGESLQALVELETQITALNADFATGEITLAQYADGLVALKDSAKFDELLPKLAEMTSRTQEMVNKLREAGQLDPGAEAVLKFFEDLRDRANRATKTLHATKEELSKVYGGGAGGGGRGGPPGDAFGDMENKAGLLSSALSRLVGVAQGLAFFGTAAHFAADFEEALVKVQNAASLTEVDLSHLTDRMVGLSRQFSNTPAEEAAAALRIISKGFRDTSETAEVLAASNKLAESTFSDVVTSAQSLATFMSVFSKDAGEAEDVMATLAVVSHGSAEELSQLAAMTQRLGERVSQAGISLEDYAAAVATLKESGMDSRIAMSGMTQLVERLANVTPKMTVEFRKWGIEIDDTTIASKGLAPVLQEIYDKTNGNKDAVTKLLGSQMAATVAMTIMKDEGEKYAKVLKQLEERHRLAAEMSERVNATFNKQAEDLKKNLLTRMTELGNTIKTLLVPALQFLNKHVDALFAVLASASAFIAVQQGLTALNRVLGISAKGFQIAVATFAGGLKEMEAAWGAFRVRLLASMNVLGALIVSAIAGWQIGKAINEELHKAFPAFDLWADLIIARVMDLGEDISYYLKKAFSFRLVFNGAEIRKQLDAEHAAADLRSQAEQDALAMAVVSDSNELRRQRAQNDKLTEEYRKAEAEKTAILEKAAKERADFNKRYGLSEATRSELDKYLAADPYAKMKTEFSELTETKRRLDAALTTDPTNPQLLAYQHALGLALEKMNVETAQLSLKKTDYREFMDSLAAGANTAVAANQNYEDSLKRLNLALTLDKDNQDIYTAAIERAGIAYSKVLNAMDPLKVASLQYAELQLDLADAIKNETLTEQQASRIRQVNLANFARLAVVGDDYKKALIALKSELEPAVAIQQTYNEKLVYAQVLLADQPELLAAYTRQLDINARAQLALNELQQNSVAELAAQYDPLIKAELERATELINLRQKVELLKISEEDRIYLYDTIAERIEQSFEQAKAAINGNVEMSQVWEEAWKATIQRVDGAFVDLWKSAFSGFKNFASQLKDTFKQLIAEIAHATFTRPLLDSFQSLFVKPGTTAQQPLPQRAQELARRPIERALMTSNTPGSPLTVGNVEDPMYRAVYRALVGVGFNPGFLGSTQAGGGAGAGGFPDLISQFLGGGSTRAGATGTAALAGVSLPDLNLSFDAFKRFPGIGGAQDWWNLPSLPGMGQVVPPAAGGPGAEAGGGGGLDLSMLTSLKGLVGKLSTTISTFTGFAGQAAQAFLTSGAHLGSLSQVGTTLQGGAAGYGTVAGQALAGAGLGYLSGGALDQLLGSRGRQSTTDTLSVVGGVIGSLWGPLGAVIGGAVGSLVSNIIGGGKKILETGYTIAAEGEKLIGTEFTKIRKYGSFFSSKTVFKEEDWNDPVFKELTRRFKEMTNALRDVAKVLDVSTDSLENFRAAAIKINTKKKSPEQIDAELQQAMLDISGQQIQHFIQSTGAISTPLQQLLGNFTILGSELVKMNPELKKAGKAFEQATHFTEEYIVAFQHLAAMQAALNAVPSVAGQKLVDEANKSLTQKYLDLAAASVEAARGFDGTIEDITRLTEAFVLQRQAAVELAAALITTQKEVTQMFADTATSIRESLMSPEELYNFRKAMAETQATELSQTTDPIEIRRLSESINSIINSLYQGLDDTQKQQMAGGFLDFLEGVDAIVRRQTDLGLQNLDESATSINEQVMNLIAGTTQQQTTAVNAFSGSVGQFGQIVDRFGQLVTRMEQQRAAIAPNSVPTSATRTTSPVSPIFVSAREVNAGA